MNRVRNIIFLIIILQCWDTLSLRFGRVSSGFLNA